MLDRFDDDKVGLRTHSMREKFREVRGTGVISRGPESGPYEEEGVIREV